MFYSNSEIKIKGHVHFCLTEQSGSTLSDYYYLFIVLSEPLICICIQQQYDHTVAIVYVYIHYRSKFRTQNLSNGNDNWMEYHLERRFFWLKRKIKMVIGLNKSHMLLELSIWWPFTFNSPKFSICFALFWVLKSCRGIKHFYEVLRLDWMLSLCIIIYFRSNVAIYAEMAWPAMVETTKAWKPAKLLVKIFIPQSAHKAMTTKKRTESI